MLAKGAFATRASMHAKQRQRHPWQACMHASSCNTNHGRHWESRHLASLVRICASVWQTSSVPAPSAPPARFLVSGLSLLPLVRIQARLSSLSGTRALQDSRGCSGYRNCTLRRGIVVQLTDHKPGRRGRGNMHATGLTARTFVRATGAVFLCVAHILCCARINDEHVHIIIAEGLEGCSHTKRVGNASRIKPRPGTHIETGIDAKQIAWQIAAQISKVAFDQACTHPASGEHMPQGKQMAQAQAQGCETVLLLLRLAAGIYGQVLQGIEPAWPFSDDRHALSLTARCSRCNGSGMD